MKVAGQGPSLLQAGPSNPSIAERLESFDYDAAQNLVTRTEVEGPVETRHEMPVDVPGRNRPASINGVSLEWDASGNLKAKGDLRFQYDWRNRLRRIETATGEEVAEYRYDAFNRRVEKVKAGVVESTAWAGWRALERYISGQLVERRTYGAGLDEVIRLETDSGARNLDAPRVPVYDDVGNLVALTDGSGTPIERYTYTSYGERTVLGSPGPVEIEQIRQVGDALWLEANVGVLPSALAAAVQGGILRLERVADGVAYDLTVTQPVQEGRQALRRVVLTPTSPPPVGESVRLVVDPGALRDEFQSTMASSLEQTFPWIAGVVVLDTAVPELEEVYIHGDMVELGWSEPMDESSGSGIQIGSETVIWTVDATGYRWTSSLVADGVYALTVPDTVVDLSGTGVEAYSANVSTESGGSALALYVAPDPRERPESVVANVLGFHGLSLDEESGLLYVRNRYLDPESGRFVTSDPLRFVDGPSAYQFAGSSPLNYGDPLGLLKVVLWYGRGSEYGLGEGFDDVAKEIRRRARESEIPFRINVVDRTGTIEIKHHSKGYEEGDGIEVYLVSSTTNHDAPILETVEQISQDLEEPLILAGHSLGAVRQHKIAKRLAKRDQKVDQFISVDMQNFFWFTPTRMPLNVERVMVAYSSPTQEQLKASTSPAEPIGAKTFSVDSSCTELYPPMAIVDVHTKIDSHPQVVQSIVNEVFTRYFVSQSDLFSRRPLSLECGGRN